MCYREYKLMYHYMFCGEERPRMLISSKLTHKLQVIENIHDNEDSEELGEDYYNEEI